MQVMQWKIWELSDVVYIAIALSVSVLGAYGGGEKKHLALPSRSSDES